MEGISMHKLTTFAHRRNFDGTYDSICTKCYATAATAANEEALSSPESGHACDLMALYMANPNSTPQSMPMLGQVTGNRLSRSEESGPTRHQKIPLQTKMRLTVKADRAD
jgi:hypothetical protein